MWLWFIIISCEEINYFWIKTLWACVRILVYNECLFQLFITTILFDYIDNALTNAHNIQEYVINLFNNEKHIHRHASTLRLWTALAKIISGYEILHLLVVTRLLWMRLCLMLETIRTSRHHPLCRDDPAEWSILENWSTLNNSIIKVLLVVRNVEFSVKHIIYVCCILIPPECDLLTNQLRILNRRCHLLLWMG